jgi:hypothetical protein
MNTRKHGAGSIVRLDRGDIAAMATAVPAEERAGALRVPLYLAGGSRPLRVYLDGPALAVAGGRKLSGRYPLDRVVRVVVSGRVEWAASALAACMEQGIPVTFLRRSGEPLGTLQPAWERVGTVASALEEFLRRPDWADVYGNWLRAAKAATAREWARAAGWNRLDERLRRTVYQAGGNRISAPGWCVSLIAERLAAAGLRPAYWGLGGRRLELASDLARLLQLALEARFEAPGDSGSAAGAAAFERHAQSLRERCERYLQEFVLRIRRFLEDGE